MESQARREKQLKIAGAGVVVVVLLGIGGVVLWNNYQDRLAEEHAANWAECSWAPEQTPEPVDPAELEAQGQPVDDAMRAEIENYNEQIEIAEQNRVTAEQPEAEQAKRGTSEVMLTLGDGDVPLTLDHAQAPCNVGSFVNLVQQDYFADSECHRLTVSEEEAGLRVLQCGDPTGTGMSGPGYMVQDEPPTDLEPAPSGGMGPGGEAVIYPRGTIAMAKGQQPNSAGSQFFLVYEDSALPPEYSVMGTIGEEGLGVLDEIAERGVASDDPSDQDNQVPAEEVVIESAELVSQEGLPEA